MSKIEKLQEKIDNIYENNEGIFNNRYILVEKINEGGMGIVYKIKDVYNEYFNDYKELVIKIPHKDLLKKKDIGALFYSEYKCLREMNHKHIIKTYDFGIEEEIKIPYIILEYLDGIPLDQMTLFNMTRDEKVSLFKTLISTIQYIHNNEIIHGDITPQNIMLSNKNKITFFDFGISQSAKSRTSISFDFNNSKAFNPKYSAPEILNGETPSMHSDMFSLALILYEIFSLELPFKLDSTELKNKPVTKTNCSKKIPLFLRQWFINILKTNPKKRRQTLPIIYKLLMFRNAVVDNSKVYLYK